MDIINLQISHNVFCERGHDTRYLDDVIIGDEEVIYADSGYLGNEALVKDAKLFPRIISQVRKQQRNKKYYGKMEFSIE